MRLAILQFFLCISFLAGVKTIPLNFIHACRCVIIGSLYDYVGGHGLSLAHTCKASVSKLFERYCTAHTATTLAESHHFCNGTNV